jgi:hypothetical protein
MGSKSMQKAQETKTGKPGRDSREKNQNALEGQAKSLNALAAQQEAMSKDIWSRTDPLRQGLMPKYAQIMQGNFDPTTDPGFGVGKAGLETKFQQELGRAMQGQRGGAMQENVAGAEINRAQGLTDLLATATINEYLKGVGIATGDQDTSFQGLRGAAQGYMGAGNIYGNVGDTQSRYAQLANQSIADAAGGAGAVAGRLSARKKPNDPYQIPENEWSTPEGSAGGAGYGR